MNEFYTALEYVNKNIYKPSGLNIESIKEEKQNINYGAGTFRLSSQETSKTARFRAAKQTPTKIGQFVAFWEKARAKHPERWSKNIRNWSLPEYV